MTSELEYLKDLLRPHVESIFISKTISKKYSIEKVPFMSVKENLFSELMKKHKEIKCRILQTDKKISSESYKILEYLEEKINEKHCSKFVAFENDLYKIRQIIFKETNIDIFDRALEKSLNYDINRNIDYDFYNKVPKSEKVIYYIFFETKLIKKVQEIIKNNSNFKVLNEVNALTYIEVHDVKYFTDYILHIKKKGEETSKYFKNKPFENIKSLLHDHRIPFFWIEDINGEIRLVNDLFNRGEKAYWKEDLQMMVMSSWEANLIRLCKNLGIKISYENKSFSLNSDYPVERIISYLPDFQISNNEYIEVKGFWDKESLHKVYLFKKNEIYHPVQEVGNYILYIIDGDMYYTIEKLYSKIIENWEKSNKIRTQNDILVVGINATERKKYIKNLKTNEIVFMARESENEYDKNAIKLVNKDNKMLGYVAKEWASIYAEKIDMGMEFECKVKQIENNKLTISVQRTNLNKDILYDFLKLSEEENKMYLPDEE